MVKHTKSSGEILEEKKAMENEQKRNLTLAKVLNAQANRKASEQIMKENTRKIVQKKPLYKRMEEKFKQEVELPELEK